MILTKVAIWTEMSSCQELILSRAVVVKLFPLIIRIIVLVKSYGSAGLNCKEKRNKISLLASRG